VFSSMTGYLRGGLVEPDAVADLLATAQDAISVARRLGIPRLKLHGRVWTVTACRSRWSRSPG